MPKYCWSILSFCIVILFTYYESRFYIRRPIIHILKYQYRSIYLLPSQILLIISFSSIYASIIFTSFFNESFETINRASRGIDFPNVDHVILFDFPRDPSEYVRRVGRTARGATGKGKAFIFVVGKQVSLARRIIERNRKGHPLHDVPSAYELTY